MGDGFSIYILPEIVNVHDTSFSQGQMARTHAQQNYKHIKLDTCPASEFLKVMCCVHEKQHIQ